MNASALLSLEQSRRTAAAVLGTLDKLETPTRFVALALLAELHSPFHGNGGDPAHPLLQSVRVSGDALGRHNAVRALFPRPLEDKFQFTRHIEELSLCEFDILDFDDLDGESTLPSLRPRNGDVLFDIVRVKEWENLHDWNAASVSWLVRAGQWAYWSMNEASRVLLCRIAAAGMTHRDQATAALTLKLGCRLGFASLLRNDGRPLDVTIEDVLAEIGDLPAKPQRHRAWASLMYMRFNTALFSLCNLGALKDVTWPTDYRFNGLRDDGGAPSDWMAARIKLKAPAMPVPQAGRPPFSKPPKTQKAASGATAFRLLRRLARRTEWKRRTATGTAWTTPSRPPTPDAPKRPSPGWTRP